MVKPSSPQGYFESPQDREVLKRLIQDELRKVHGTTQRPGPTSPDYYAPEVKLVWVPASGVVAPTGYEPTGTGTGTNTLSRTSCHVHRIDQLASGLEVAYAGYDIDVVNPTPVTIPGSQWVLAVRENSGPYVVVPIIALVSATPTQPGIVDTVDQSFGGLKTFVSGQIVLSNTVPMPVAVNNWMAGFIPTCGYIQYTANPVDNLAVLDLSVTLDPQLLVYNNRSGVVFRRTVWTDTGITTAVGNYVDVPYWYAYSTFTFVGGSPGQCWFLTAYDTTRRDQVTVRIMPAISVNYVSGSWTADMTVFGRVCSTQGFYVGTDPNFIGTGSGLGVSGTDPVGTQFTGGICTHVGTTGASTTITVGTTPVTGGTSGDILTDAGGVAGSSSLSSLLDGLGGLGGAGTTYGG